MEQPLDTSGITEHSAAVRIPVYADVDGEVIEVGYQEREPGKPPKFRPWGIEITKCLPYLGRVNETGVILGCEGPTDAMAAVQVPALQSCSIVGCWSSTSTPGRAFWESRFRGRSCPLVACGDHDASGRAFNQRLADEYGLAYPIKWPAWFAHKGDVKQWLTEQGAQSFQGLVRAALASAPLVPSPARTVGPQRAYTCGPVPISTLIEAAGGTPISKMATGGWKWLCPLHNDRDDPSLTSNDESGSWKCWSGCGQGGPIQFLMAWKSLSFDDAKELLKKYV